MRLGPDQLERAAKAAGTPLYAYCATTLRNRARQLRYAVPNAAFFYSLKSNPNKSIVRILSQEGVGAEVCSHRELMTALAAGVPPSQIIFVGPAKSAKEISAAVEHGIKAIIAESLDELILIDQIAADVGCVQNVALRINPVFHTKGARLSMSGKPTQFGIDELDLSKAFDLIEASNHIRLAGIHIYMGTRILDYRVILENTDNILKLATDLIVDRKIPLEFVDIGGGFGIPYTKDEPTLDIDALGQGLCTRIEDFKKACPKTKVVIELGRYFVGEAGVFVTKVQYIKQSKGINFAICDGGSNAHAAAAQAASFKRNFPVSLVRPGISDTEIWNISGPLCTPTDLIAQGLETPPLKAGDLVRIDQSGAYGMTFSPVSFLSFESPAEVLIDGEDVFLIRHKTSIEAHLNSQIALRLSDSIGETEEEKVRC